MSALQEDCKKGQKWVSCTLVVFQSAYMADIQCRLIIRRHRIVPLQKEYTGEFIELFCLIVHHNNENYSFYC